MMDREVIERILDAYGISYETIALPQKGYRNSSYAIELPNDQRLNVMVYKAEPNILNRIKRAHVTEDILAGKGLPVRQLKDPRIIQLKFGETVQYAAIYNYLPGATIPWDAYTKDHIKLVGMAMSTMHAYLKNAGTVENSVVDEYAEINKRMGKYFSQPGVRDAMRQKLRITLDISVFAGFGQVLKQCVRLPGQQILHMDFVRGNLLFSPANPTDRFVVGDTALTGIIDFEKVAYGHPAFDIARTLAFLLVDCKRKPDDKIRKYFLQSGYNKRGKARFSETAVTDGSGSFYLLEQLTSLFLVYDFYKFLRHNPYDYLDSNEHFIRTRDILISQKVLESC